MQKNAKLRKIEIKNLETQYYKMYFEKKNAKKCKIEKNREKSRQIETNNA